MRIASDVQGVHDASVSDESEDEKAFEKWWEEIEKGDPSASLVLRGHLLLEEQINLFFEKTLIHPELIDKMQFRQKLRLLRAMRKEGKTGKLWEMIELLNTLRNQTAHGLLEKNARKKIATVERIRKLSAAPPDLALYDIVYGAFAYTTSGLNCIVEDIEEKK